MDKKPDLITCTQCNSDFDGVKGRKEGGIKIKQKYAHFKISEPNWAYIIRGDEVFCKYDDTEKIVNTLNELTDEIINLKGEIAIYKLTLEHLKMEAKRMSQIKKRHTSLGDVP